MHVACVAGLAAVHMESGCADLSEPWHVTVRVCTPLHEQVEYVAGSHAYVIGAVVATQAPLPSHAE